MQEKKSKKIGSNWKLGKNEKDYLLCLIQWQGKDSNLEMQCQMIQHLEDLPIFLDTFPSLSDHFWIQQ